MDVVKQCLALAPVPYLSLAVSIIQSIWTSVQEVKASKDQLETLAQSSAQLVVTLDKEYKPGKFVEEGTQEALGNLASLLEEISAFVDKQSTYGFFELLIKKEDRVVAIEGFHRRLENSARAFEISALMNIQWRQERCEEARKSDQARLHAYLTEIASNQRRLNEALGIPNSNPMPKMVTLQRCIDEKKGDAQELKFFSRCLSCLSTASGKNVDTKQWTITRFDVEFGPAIGAGGFGEVFGGKWNHTDVAIKVVKNPANVAPTSTSLVREITTWSDLRHPHILQFLGANILDDEPFIVMPLMRNGSVHDFINNNPASPRLHFVQDMSLGLEYLHSRNVIHGDLKAMNVLVDEGQRALLSDFGLARIKANINSRSTSKGTQDYGFFGSQNWMAPELFEGSQVEMACDIYSFGMTVYEILANEIPLGHIPSARFADFVVGKGTRPPRPDKLDAPELTDKLWELTQSCWRKDPLHRPIASVLSGKLAEAKSKLPTKSGPAPVSAPYSTISAPSPPTSSTQASKSFFSKLIPFKRNSEKNSPMSVAPGGLQGIEALYRRYKATPKHVAVCQCVLLNDAKEVYSVAQSPDGGTIYVGHGQGIITSWNSDTGALIENLKVNDVDDGIENLVVLPISGGTTRYVYTIGDAIAIQAEGRTGVVHSRLVEGNVRDDPTWYCVSAKAAGKRGYIVKALSSENVIYTIANDVSKPSTRLDVGGKMFFVWFKEGRRRTRRDFGDSSWASIAVSPQADRFFLGRKRESTILVFGAGTGQEAGPPLQLLGKQQNWGEAKSLAPSLRGDRMVAVYESGGAVIWGVNPGTYKVLRPAGLKAKKPQFRATWSPSDHLVALCDANETDLVTIHRADTGRWLASVRLENVPCEFVRDIFIGPNDDRLIVWSSDPSCVVVYKWEC